MIPRRFSKQSDLLYHLEPLHHSTGHVVGNMAVKHSDAGVIRLHVRDDRLQRAERRQVEALAIDDHRVSVPMRRVEIEVSGRGKRVPADALSLLHGHPFDRQIAMNKPVHIVHLVERRAQNPWRSGRSFSGVHEGNVPLHKVCLVFTKLGEQGHEFSVDIFGGAVGSRHSTSGYHHRTDQARVYVPDLVGMRVIGPHHRT